jgi:hypothetical protein
VEYITQHLARKCSSSATVAVIVVLVVITIIIIGIEQDVEPPNEQDFSGKQHDQPVSWKEIAETLKWNDLENLIEKILWLQSHGETIEKEKI